MPTDRELTAFRAANFDWTMHVRSVWSDPPHDVAELQGPLRQEISQKLDDLQRSDAAESPLGWILVGHGGSGKTHLLSVVRREALRRRSGFVLVDMTDVRDFWETVLLGYTSSLQQAYDGQRFQHEVLLEHFLSLLGLQEPPARAMEKLRTASADRLGKHIALVLNVLRRRYPAETLRFQDVIRALVALNSDDFGTASAGLAWLYGHTLEDDDRRALGFSTSGKPARDIVEALSWLMSLVGPTVLAFDQLDPIIAQLNLADLVEGTEIRTEEVVTAQAIVDSVGNGLAALHEVTRRTLVLVSGLETTVNRLFSLVKLASAAARFEQPRSIKAINTPAVAEAIVAQRMRAACEIARFDAPYPTWPFAPEAFRNVQGLSPRALLQICETHRLRCLREGAVSELTRLAAEGGPGVESPKPGSHDQLDQRFQTLRLEADLAQLVEEKLEDERLAPLLQAACRAWIIENPAALRSGDVDALVDVDFQGGTTTRSLHARLRLVYRREGDREDHFCLRALQRTNALAFQARLKAAMTHSGIDRRLRFRRLAIVRTTPLPGGKVTGTLVEAFEQDGGRFVSPSDDDLRTLWAVGKLLEERDDDLVGWLLERRPISRLDFTRHFFPGLSPVAAVAGEIGQLPDAEPPAVAAAVASDSQADAPIAVATATASDTAMPTGAAEPPVATAPNADRGSPSRQASAIQPAAASADARIPLGHRLPAGGPLTMPLANMERHTVILAGAGSGKTVLLRRLIEEAALLAIPAIVVDCANDLATLGDPWPAPPAAWADGDSAKAARYHDRTEVVVWTPGRDSGRPLTLEPLPDLAALADDDEQLGEAVDSARESLRPIMAPGATPSAQNKAGILSAALKYFARSGGGSLSDFAAILADLPPEAGLGLSKEPKLAREMADRLRVEMETSPLLRGSGRGLDPAMLFGDADPSSRTRISVINLVGLPGLDMQRQFVNQLAMTLFAWIKKHPSPTGRPLRGLLAIDEAKDFIPAREQSACKASLKRLAAQARKYHLGLIFATQHPREIDNALVGNCSTHYYGKASSPAAIETIREQIQYRGGSGGDIATLDRGHFYAYTADIGIRAPLKVRVPLCLSHHPPNPLDERAILTRAAGPP